MVDFNVNVPEHLARIENTGKRVYKYGFSDVVGTTEATIWDGVGTTARVLYLSAATVLKISSGSAQDAAAGTGVKKVTIFGQDANYAEISETVTLTGQTAVNTTNSYLRIYRAYCTELGSGNTGLTANAGAIYAGTGTVTAGVPAVVYLIITAEQGQTLHCQYTVPASKTAYIRSVFVSGDSSKIVTCRLMTRKEDESWRCRDKFLVFSGITDIKHELPIAIAEKTDIEIRAVVSASTTEVGAGIEMYVDNA